MKMKDKKNEYGSTAHLVTNMATNEDKVLDDTIAVNFDASEEKNIIKTGLAPEPVEERVLTPDEKSYLLCVERGDTASAKSIIEALSKRPQIFDINCVDPLGRSALIIAVENENIDMIEMLLAQNINPKDALLVAIREGVYKKLRIFCNHGFIYRSRAVP